MKLYIDNLWLSPYTFSIFCALREKKLDFTLHPVAFEKAQSKDPKFTGLTPTDLIPALEDEGHVFSESLAILEYLDEKYAAPQHPRLLPTHVVDRAKARMFLSWHRCAMTSLRDQRSSETLFFPSERKSLKPLNEQTREEVREWTTAVKAHLKHGQQFLFGEWSIADSEVAFMAHRLIVNGDEIDEQIKAYAENIWRRPAIQEYVNQKRPEFKSFYT